MENEQQNQHEKHDKRHQKPEQETKHIIRIANTDILGDKTTMYGLTNIKGIGFVFSNAICKSLKLNPFKKAGLLTEKEVDDIEELLKNPKELGLPSWLFNRRKDYETGEDIHLTSTDVRFVEDNDTKRMKMIKTYKGIRHQHKLPVRGQRTKANFRRNKGKAVAGVKKKGVARK